jgi:hypothetical protein
VTTDPPEIPAPPAPPWAAPGAGLVLAADPERFGPAAGKPVTVRELTPWGALCSTAFGTGEIRVRWDEVGPAPDPEPAAVKAKKIGAARVAARQQGYTGDPCPTCQALKLRHNGACLYCDNCQTSTGCS